MLHSSTDELFQRNSFSFSSPHSLTSLAHEPEHPCYTFLLFRSYLKNKRTLGHLVTEKLASLRLKEMENCLGAKWPCDFKSPWHTIYLIVPSCYETMM